MEDIDGSIVLHVFLHEAERGKKEEIELVVLHVIVPYLPCGSLIRDIVWRIGDDEISLTSGHETLIGEGICAVAADEPVPSERPDVARACHLRL